MVQKVNFAYIPFKPSLLEFNSWTLASHPRSTDDDWEPQTMMVNTCTPAIFVLCNMLCVVIAAEILALTNKSLIWKYLLNLVLKSTQKSKNLSKSSMKEQSMFYKTFIYTVHVLLSKSMGKTVHLTFRKQLKKIQI